VEHSEPDPPAMEPLQDLERPDGGRQDTDDPALILDRGPRERDIVLAPFMLCYVMLTTLGASLGTTLLRPLIWGSVGLLAFLLLAAWLIVLNGIRVPFFRRERIRLDSRGLDYLRVDALLPKRRSIPLASILRVSPYRVMVGDGQYALCPEYGLVIETPSQPLHMGQSCGWYEVERLQERIERRLRELNPAWVNAPWCDDPEVLDASGTLPEPPSDNQIVCRREWDHTVFSRCVHTHWSTMLPALAWAVIGIVTLGVIQVKFLGTLGAFSLICVVPIGLAILGLIVRWVWRLFYPQRWDVRPGEITMSHPVLGVGWSRTTEIEWLDRIELRRIHEVSRPWLADRIAFGSFVPGFELALVDLDGRDVAILGPFTEGEARWVGGILAEVLKDALPRSGQSVARWSVKVDAPVSGSTVMSDPYLDEPAPGVGLPHRQK
jgi:hypothetical protein